MSQIIIDALRQLNETDTSLNYCVQQFAHILTKLANAYHIDLKDVDNVVGVSQDEFDKLYKKFPEAKKYDQELLLDRALHFYDPKKKHFTKEDIINACKEHKDEIIKVFKDNADSNKPPVHGENGYILPDGTVVNIGHSSVDLFNTKIYEIKGIDDLSGTHIDMSDYEGVDIDDGEFYFDDYSNDYDSTDIKNASDGVDSLGFIKILSSSNGDYYTIWSPENELGPHQYDSLKKCVDVLVKYTKHIDVINIGTYELKDYDIRNGNNSDDIMKGVEELYR